MPQFFYNKRLIVLLVCIILLVALIGFSMKDRSKLSWPEQVLKDTIGLFQSILHQPAEYAAGFFENISELKTTFEENRLLKARLDEYVELNARVLELEKENERLRAILGKKESLRDYKLIQANVIARNPDYWHELIFINKGEQHGVKKNMAVITSEGMIGKIKQVSQFTSTVQLLSAVDRTNRISAVVKGNADIFGLIEGYDEKKGALLFKRIPYDVKINLQEKQTVVTSGLGGVFPSGLVIGEIIEVVPDEYGLTQMAYVKPSANFFDIDHLMIVERLSTTPDTELLEQMEGGI
ncbi:rod shape-determining protein MreC [Calidifontibacillus erzurumensis]|uniref:Cell shape-determining protein MreC n=1 Tax=Calidifontibacillus erzurumensis TaxID=2741433 RepID=A0A8J8GCX3_9BACI|nr:rod shape-determining protein MreC [Calidifontibacillus erzurumensis]NSL51615.1 rod shape-determining protein MreC [Calidifontibacillus erzurumensis]